MKPEDLSVLAGSERWEGTMKKIIKGNRKAMTAYPCTFRIGF